MQTGTNDPTWARPVHEPARALRIVARVDLPIDCLGARRRVAGRTGCRIWAGTRRVRTAGATVAGTRRVGG